MGRRMVVFDDITGEEDAEKRPFAVGGEAIEIDLTDEGYAEFLEAINPWLRAGTVVGKVTVEARNHRPRPMATTESAIKHTPDEVTALRTWCTARGVRGVRESGRIGADIWQAFHADDLTLLLKKHLPEAGDAVPLPPSRMERAQAEEHAQTNGQLEIAST